ncbi:hypothetical protein D7X25_27035 [bacterium 1XD42-8]|jgi:hypothetical protein|uniref:hypothetical protein n=1 Tax=Parablautia intestinalis TaxID=2320100 RepID=UPI000EA3EA65|nr:hypothetical protein [Parablautia intestinalis]MCI9140782.1 hypothetical protein [Lachnospiraceae bacterium]RKJ42507.1 hypothetical protein D7X25_27035 [bacterium 1XD42-8]
MAKHDFICALYGEVLFTLLSSGFESSILEFLSQQKDSVKVEDIFEEFQEYDREKLRHYLNACASGHILRAVDKSPHLKNAETVSSCV